LTEEFQLFSSLFQFMTLDKTFVRPSAKTFFVSTRTFAAIVAPYGLWLVIVYANAIGNDVL
jgi:hypothetical protein